MLRLGVHFCCCLCFSCGVYPPHFYVIEVSFDFVNM